MKPMPNCLDTFLKSTSDDQADEIWLYLDAEPEVLIALIIDKIAEYHPELVKRITNVGKTDVNAPQKPQ